MPAGAGTRLTERTFERPLPPGVHVILGDSAAGIFNRVFHPGDRLVVDRDVLCCGPTACCKDLGSWCEMRRAFWSGIDPGSAPKASDFGLADQSLRIRTAEQVTIWAATSLSEQLFIVHAIHRAEEWGVDAAKIHLVQFETLRNRAACVLGLGELNEQHMSEHPEPTTVSNGAFRDYRGAWSALTSPDPGLIARFGENHPNATEWLKRADARDSDLLTGGGCDVAGHRLQLRICRTSRARHGGALSHGRAEGDYDGIQSRHGGLAAVECGGGVLRRDVQGR